MPNIKRITLATAEGTGKTVYAIIRREADGWLLNDADGSFSAAPADPYTALAEHATLKGVYERDESRSAWNDGAYLITAYLQAGGAPAPASDTVIAQGTMFIRDDAEFSMATLAVDTEDLIDNAFGKWVLDPTGKTLTLYKQDGVTVLKTFNLGTTSTTCPAFISRTPA